MNTLRYKTEYLERVINLLKESPVNVHPSSDIFFEIGKLFEEEPDGEKLDKLLKKTYTVMVIDEGNLIGLAGMDKEGYIGLFADDGGNKKVQKALLNALDRRAEKTEIPQLFVQPFEDTRDIFINHGYEPMDEGDDFNLIKKNALKEKPGIKPEKVKEFTLNPSKPIVVEGKQSVLPFFLLGMACFFMFLLITLSVTKYKNAFAENDTDYIVIFTVVMLFFAVALALFTGYFIRRAKLKKQVLSMRITNGVIISFTTHMTRDPEDTHFAVATKQAEYTHVFITYEYYDENMVKHQDKFTHRYRFSGPYFYEGQELVIAHFGETSYILHKYTFVNPPDETEETTEETSGLSEEVSAKKLSNYVPLKAAKIYYGYALSYFCAFAIVFVFFLVFGIIRGNYTGLPMFGEILKTLLFGLPFLGILGGFAIYAISIPLIAKYKYKKMLASPDVKCIKGKIVHADKTFKSDNKMRFYCEFNDGYGKRSVLVPYRSASNLVKSGNTSVLVVYTKTTAMALVKKGVYPDKFSFSYYRN